MALNKRNAETARSYDPADYAVEDATTNADENRFVAARLADVLDGTARESAIGGRIEAGLFDGVEVYAHWSDADHGVVLTVHARRKLTSAEMGRLGDHMLRNPSRLAIDVYEEWAATLDRPLEYHGRTVLPAEHITIDLTS